MGEFEGVNAGIASDAAGAGSAPGAGDASGQTLEATGTPGLTPAGVPETGHNVNGADAGAVVEDDGSFGLTDDQVAAAPQEWREKFGSLLSGHKSLVADHRTLKAEYDDLRGIYEGLHGIARNEDGSMVLDPSTGLPVPSTQAFVEKLGQSSPAVLTQLFNDLWGARTPEGQTFAQAMFHQLGLDPARLEDYQAITRDPYAASVHGVIPADELETIPDKYHDIYKKLTPDERFKVQGMDDNELHAYMKEKQLVNELTSFKESIEQERNEQKEQAMKSFWSDVEKSHLDYVTQLRQSGFSSIQKSLTDQIQFSADSSINAVQTGAVMSIVASILEPGMSDVVNPILSTLGIQVDDSLQNAVRAIEEQAYIVKRYEAINSKPELSGFRNEAVYRQAQSEVNRLNQQILAKLNGVALKVAKAIAGGNQEMRDVGRRSVPRPTAGGVGQSPSGNGAAPQGVQPFTMEWLSARQQGRL